MMFDQDSISNKSQMVTFILCLLFGGLGAHRFYVGKYVTGIVYALIGGSSIVFKVLGVGWGIVSWAVLMVLLIYDVYALYSDSFTDSKDRLVIDKSRILEYETFEEREQILFVKKLNKILTTTLVAAVYIIYLILSKYVF